MERFFKVGDLKAMLSERSAEFKPVIGAGVEKENMDNNGKAYRESKKRAEDYDGGLSKKTDGRPKYVKEDPNKTTLDVNPENVTDEYRKRVKAQAEGYTSEAEKNNGIEKSGDFTDNGNIYDGIKKSGQEMHRNDAEYKAGGLRAREFPKEKYRRDEIYEERSTDGNEMRSLIDRFRAAAAPERKIPVFEERNLKTLYFKKTRFQNESHMKSRIPDDFKNDGNVFRMKDCTGAEFILEWHDGGAEVLSSRNPDEADRTVEECKRLSGYDRSGYGRSTAPERESENFDTYRKTVDLMRSMNKKQA